MHDVGEFDRTVLQFQLNARLVQRNQGDDSIDCARESVRNKVERKNN